MNPMRLSTRGVSLVEVLVGMIVLSTTLLGLTGATAVGLRQTARARADGQYLADVQFVMDSLVARGWGNVTGGSVTRQGRAISWTVGSASPSPQQITLVAQRSGYQNRYKVVRDTVVMYLAKSKVGP